MFWLECLNEVNKNRVISTFIAIQMEGKITHKNIADDFGGANV